MKKIYFLLLAFGLFASVNAQVINFTDVNFKAILLSASPSNTIAKDLTGNYFKIDVNNDGEIQLSEASNVTSLNLSSVSGGSQNNLENINNIIGINAFQNLKFFYSEFVFFKGTLDFTGNQNIEEISIKSCICDEFDLINLAGLKKLVKLSLISIRQSKYPFTSHRVNVVLEGSVNLVDLNIYNSFVTINYCEIPNLKYLDSSYLEGGEPEIFDFSCLTKLETLNISENLIKILVLKNGSLLKSLSMDLRWYDFPKYICTDENLLEIQQVVNQLENGYTTVINEYCSFKPGGNYNIIIVVR